MVSLHKESKKNMELITNTETSDIAQQLLVEAQTESNEILDSTSQTNQMRKFMRIFSGQAFSLVGSALVQFSLVWWLTVTTGSATVLIMATMMAILPQIVISPFVGPLIDRWSRRKVMIASDGLSAIMIIGLATLWWQGIVDVLHIFLIMAIRSALASFQWPALQASASLMVPKKNLSRVNGMYQALTGLAKIAAPPLGALLLVFLPIQAILMIDVGTAALAILPLILIQIPQPSVKLKEGSTVSGILSEMMEGFSYMKNWVAGKYVTVALMMTNFILAPTFSLTPLLVMVHFAGGAIELAWMESMMGVGMVAGGVALGIWGGFRRRMLTAIVALIFASGGVFVLGLAPQSLIAIAIGGIFIAGFMIPMASGSLMAVIQAVVPHELQGRVFTVLMSLGPAMAPFGLIVAGGIVELFGIQSWFILGGIGLALVGILGSLVPNILKVGEVKDDQ